MNQLRFAIFGAGFWAHYQLAAWRELKAVECVAIYNRTLAKAEALAKTFDVRGVYSDPEQLLAREKLDFVDIITDVDSHAHFVKLAAERGLPVICQKPMAPTLKEATELVEFCRRKKVPFFVHENWRWQTPIRQLHRILTEGHIGAPFRARIDMISGFPVFANQPFLKELEQFILTDLGTHILDVARFLFGEAHGLYCQTNRVHRDIQGEDVATVMMRMGKAETAVLCEMAYAENPLEREVFPQTLIFVEGEKGSLELAPDYWIRLTTKDGTLARRYPPQRYAWANPAYDVVQASIVDCHANLLGALPGKHAAETTGEDNLKTLKLVFAAYDSAAKDQVLHPTPH
jgi:predicted dehydrogenase